MADWKPMGGLTLGGRRGRPSRPGVWLIAKKANPVFRFPPTVAAAFGDAGFVEPLRNGNPQLVGLRATRPAPGRTALKLSNGSERGTNTRTLTATGILKEAGKLVRCGEHQIPAVWDDGVLVLDLSGIPSRGGA